MNIDDYDAVFVPGGWGPMEDLSENPAAGRLLSGWLASGKIVSLVCHGLAALLSTVDPDGKSPFHGCRLTGLSNSEEIQNGLADRAKWLLQDRLISDVGADCHKGEEKFASPLEVERILVTGQNPASAVPLAREVVKVLG